MLKKIIKKACSFFANYILVYCIPRVEIQNITPAMAEELLEKHSPNPKTSTFWKNEIESSNELDLTIIVPVYNVEKYLEKCIESIVNQRTTYTYNLILINDASPDKSCDVINRFLCNSKVTVIHHSTNQGVSAARNTGLQKMCGKYVMFVDSDDFLPDNAIQELLNAAYRLNADILQGGYQYIDGGIKEKKMGCLTYPYRESIPPNGVMAGMVCGKVYRSNLFYQVCFPEKYWYEDTIITAIISHLAKSIATIPSIVYYYRQNPSGQTKDSKGKPKSIDTFWVHRCVLEAREKLGLKVDVDFYEHLLRMVILSYRRTELEPKQVKICLLILFREMLQSVRKDDFIVKQYYKNLEVAIMNLDYNRYSFLCKFIV